VHLYAWSIHTYPAKELIWTLKQYPATLFCFVFCFDSELWVCEDMLLQELYQNSKEDQIGFRNGIRHVLRLTNAHPIAEEAYPY
jgi:hypothetical protein